MGFTIKFVPLVFFNVLTFLFPTLFTTYTHNHHPSLPLIDPPYRAIVDRTSISWVLIWSGALTKAQQSSAEAIVGKCNVSIWIILGMVGYNLMDLNGIYWESLVWKLLGLVAALVVNKVLMTGLQTKGSCSWNFLWIIDFGGMFVWVYVFIFHCWISLVCSSIICTIAIDFIISDRLLSFQASKCLEEVGLCNKVSLGVTYSH